MGVWSLQIWKLDLRPPRWLKAPCPELWHCHVLPTPVLLHTSHELT